MSVTKDRQKVKLFLCITDDIGTGEYSPIIEARVWGRPKEEPDISTELAEQINTSGKTKGLGQSPAWRDCSPPFQGTTGPDGCAIFHVEPGSYQFHCEAFGFEISKDICVEEPQAGARCEVRESVRIPVGFQFESQVIPEDCQTPATCTTNAISEGTPIILKASHQLTSQHLQKNPVKFSWHTTGGRFLEPSDQRDSAEVHLDTTGFVGDFIVTASLSEVGSATLRYSTAHSSLPRPTQKIGGDLNVTLRRAGTEPTDDLPLWVVIRKSTEAISFNNYFRFLNHVLCGEPLSPDFNEYEKGKIRGKIPRLEELRNKRFLPFTDAEAYRILKVATEAFLMVNCGVFLKDFPFVAEDLEYVTRRVGVSADLSTLWGNYLKHVNGTSNQTLPYLALIRDKLRDVRLMEVFFADFGSTGDSNECFGLLSNKLTEPCLLELIWSYWHEEGMLVQTLNAITRRFQNVRHPAKRDPLANMEIDPLRPLNNLLWGYIQDEQHRLSVVRRTYEYDHHYGLRLYGKAVPELRPADTRSKFLEAFHNLLHLSTLFFHQDDDTTVVADGFPLLNALQEVHLILSQGAHNQFGDGPSTARIEMMMQQWLLARPEFREFLPTRIMVAYPEPWMDRVDAMKKAQGWTDTSVMHFRSLGMFGEQILLSIRYGAWSDVNDPVRAANWARFWRPEIQGYIHAYRSVTGVDLTLKNVDFILPSVHLRKRLALQQQQK